MLLHSKTTTNPLTRLAKKYGLWVSALFVFSFGMYAQFQAWPNAALESTRNAYHRWPTQFSAWSKSKTIPVINIDVKFKHMETVGAKRRKALNDGVLVTSGDDFVPASLRVDGRTISVKLRLKGDWTDHLVGDKWSLRIKTRDNDQLWGMRTFSLQHPSTRSWDGEWLYHRHLQAEGVLGLRYLFVEARMNGDDLGIFALEEHFSKELLESQQRREGVIIKPDEAGLWERRVTMRKYHSLRHEDLPAMNLVAFGEKAVASSAMFTNHATAAIQKFDAVLSGELPASRAFHVERTAKFLAVTEFWSADHALAFHNFRLYYDPLTGLLEPIGFDANPLQHMHYSLLATESEWTQRLLDDPEVQTAYRKHLERMTTRDYLQSVFEKFHEPWDDVVHTLQREWPEFQPSIWSRVEKRRRIVKQLLQPSELAFGWFHYEQGDGQYEAQVSVANVTSFSVDVRWRPILPNEGANDREQWTAWRSIDPATSNTVFEFSGESVVAIEAEARVTGTKVVQKFMLDNRSVSEIQSPTTDGPNWELLTWDAEADAYTFNSTHVVIDNVIEVPRGKTLKVAPGAKIEIVPNGKLICDRIELSGTAAEPITMELAGAFFVRESLLANHVNFQGTSENASFQSRGVTVDLSHCNVMDLELHTRYLRAESVRFYGSAKYAVKSAGHAKFVDCRFEGNYECAISARGSGVDLRQSSITNSKTAILSDGGHCKLKDVLITKVETAIQAERLSTIECENVFINGAKRGLVCGEQFSYPAFIDCVRLQVGGVDQLTKHHVGSRITIDKQHAAPVLRSAN